MITSYVKRFSCLSYLAIEIISKYQSKRAFETFALRTLGKKSGVKTVWVSSNCGLKHSRCFHRGVGYVLRS